MRQMHLGEWLCAALGVVIVAPIALVSIPIALPLAIVAIVSITKCTWRFWRLRTGDVLRRGCGTSFVVIHPPKKDSEFRCLELNNQYIVIPVLHVWKNVGIAQSDLARILPESLTETICDPMRCTKRLPLHRVTELLAGENAEYRCVIHDTIHRYRYGFVGEDERFWMRLTAFEFMRPVRVIQRAWRAHAARRRQAAARVITRAALNFLYRPNGRMYEAASRRWHDQTVLRTLPPCVCMSV